MKQPKTTIASLPSDPVDRLEAVGRTVYGKHWRSALAVALGMSRATVYAWSARRFAPPDNLDELLLAIVERRQGEIEDMHRVATANLSATAAALKQRATKK